MPFYAIHCDYNDYTATALRQTRESITLGVVEGETPEANKTLADQLVGELTRRNRMDGHKDYPFANFYFRCTPVEPVASVGDILHANAEFFAKSYHWSGASRRL